MSGAERGGIVEDMRDMAKMFGRNARSLDGIIKDLNTRTVNSDRIWKGPAADRFRSEWQEAKASFEKMRQALDSANTAITKNAERIEDATNR
jgi:WXG100 family type VII secretion target